MAIEVKPQKVPSRPPPPPSSNSIGSNDVEKSSTSRFPPPPRPRMASRTERLELIFANQADVKKEGADVMSDLSRLRLLNDQLRKSGASSISMISCSSNGFQNEEEKAPKMPPRPLRLPKEAANAAGNVVAHKREDFSETNVSEGKKIEEQVEEDDKISLQSGLHSSRKIQDENTFNLMDFVRKFPHGNGRYISAKQVLKINNVDRPIGLTLLPNKQIIISEQKKNMVKIYQAKDGKLAKVIQPGRPFNKPSDTAALPDGRFAVRDSGGIQLFDENGDFLKPLCASSLGYIFGLTTNESGQFITINSGGSVTQRGEHDVLIIDPDTDSIVNRIELADVISDKEKSKCRFLHYFGKKLFVVDLGLNCVYVMSLKDMKVKTFGSQGKGDGQFIDPAGLVTDPYGNFIVADAGNHRLQIFDKSKKYVGMVHIRGGLKRPSGTFLDSQEPALYVLNLRGNCMNKYLLEK